MDTGLEGSNVGKRVFPGSVSRGAFGAPLHFGTFLNCIGERVLNEKMKNKSIIRRALTVIAFSVPVPAQAAGSTSPTISLPVFTISQQTLAQYHLDCSATDSGKTDCTADLTPDFASHPGSRFAVQYINASISTSGDEKNPRNFKWSIGWLEQAYQASFQATSTDTDSTGSRTFVASENVLLLVEPNDGSSVFLCLANRPNEEGESFDCSFVVTGSFVP